MGAVCLPGEEAVGQMVENEFFTAHYQKAFISDGEFIEATDHMRSAWRNPLRATDRSRPSCRVKGIPDSCTEMGLPARAATARKERLGWARVAKLVGLCVPY